jgi:hypothetical protein
MRDSDDDHRGEDQHPSGSATTEPRTQAAGAARMLANPRRIRRA